MKNELVIIVDFGGQYNQLIARRVRDLNVYCEVIPYHKALVEIKNKKPIGIIFTGGPNSVYDENAPKIEKEIFELDIPILGLCYGMQLISQTLGGSVEKADKKEFGKTLCIKDKDSKLISKVKDETIVWMSHQDQVVKLPYGFECIQHTDTCPYAGIENEEKKIYAVQYHPEVNHSEEGNTLINSFLYDICRAKGDWTMKNFMNEQIKKIKETVQDRKVLLALSGGVDSSVCAALLSKAIGNKLTCVFVDTGLMRKNEGDEVQEAFKDEELNFVRVNAKDRFLGKLKGITDPEQKRKIIGEEFVRVFEDEAKKIGQVDYLGQGTIYPDVIESGLGDAKVIKSHHNVGGLPDVVDFKELIEPLRDLFKDEVRRLGLELKMPEYLVYRQPFPGPGLGIRVMGEVTEEKLEILREADAIFREEIAKAKEDKNIGQYFAVLTNNRTVGVMGDFRTYDYTLALRAVTTTDFMTADWARIPYEILDRVSVRIVNEVE
ncbi:MAG: glutamine-hydrolyzing GMP synthase, partial [Parvimonas sp.]|uniref:glutamine-hydrolyzing GMP synthase n=1 Tax=Parvimonas sp. TaxID=1944660 RepID=UPI0025E92EC0